MTSLLPPASEPDSTVDTNAIDGPDDGKQPTTPRPRPAALGALLAVGWTAPAGALLCAGIAVTGWLLGGQADAEGAPSAARLGTNIWLLTHHAPIGFGENAFGLAPLGLGTVLAVICFFAGCWITRTSELERTLDLTVAIVTYVCCYSGFATLVALLSRTGAMEVSPWRAFCNTGVLAGVPAAIGILTERGDLSRWVRTAPPRVRSTVRAAAFGVGTLLGAGTLLVLVGLVVNGGRIGEFGTALQPGISGWIVLALLCLVYLPNAALYAVSYLLGPGFALGAGTVVSPTAVALGPLPTFPLLAAVPAEAEGASWMLVVVLVPVTAGALAGSVVFRRHPDLSPRWALFYGGGAGLLMALTLSGLTTLAGGSAGPGRMAEFGAATSWVMLTAILLCGAGAAGAAAAVPLWRWRGGSRLALVGRLTGSIGNAGKPGDNGNTGNAGQTTDAADPARDEKSPEVELDLEESALAIESDDADRR